VNKVVLRQQAEDGLRQDLQPGERIAAGSAVTSHPSRWGAAVLLVVSLALIAASLASLLGPLPVPSSPWRCPSWDWAFSSCPGRCISS
jgi:hypothetical protein